MKILFFIQHLGLGGVLRQISILADQLARRGHNVSFLALYPSDQNWHLLGKLNVELRSLIAQKPKGILFQSIQLVKAGFALRSLLRQEDIEILYGFQGPSARFLAWVATRGLPNTELVWGNRGSSGRGSGQRTTPHGLGWKSALLLQLSRLVSGTVPLVISNSEAGYVGRKARRFQSIKHLVIYNGFDTDNFRPDLGARMRVRSEWTIQHERLIGIVARFYPSKGHRIFLEAAALLCKEWKDVRLVVVGDGPLKTELESFARALGLTESLIWAGPRGDMPAVYNALDILCSSSIHGEGFPNVIGEAMACGVPCVVTDVGDSAKIVGDQGIVVPPGDARMLANGLEKMLLNLNNIDPGEIRGRIARLFSIENLVDATEKALAEVCRTLK